MKFKFKILYLLIVFAGAISTSRAQNQHDLYGMWIKRAVFGSGGNANIVSSVIDEEGNVYVTGVFTGSLNFSDDICNPKIRKSTDGQYNIFLIKYDKEGNYQWDAVVANSTNKLAGVRVYSLDYKNGRVLLATGLSYEKGTNSLPLKTNIVDCNGTITISSSSIEDGSPSNRWIHASILLFNSETGKLDVTIGDHTKGTSFPTGSADFIARLEDNQVFALHFGYASVYPTASPPGIAGSRYSVSSSYNLTDGSPIFQNKLFPSQPLSTHPEQCDGSRIRQHITLADQSQIVVTYAHDYTEQNGGAGIPAFYLLSYSADFGSRNKAVLLSSRVIDARFSPKISSDAGSNVYLLMNYGQSRFWNTGNPISNSNTISNFLGSGKNFSTGVQCNKIILSRLDKDLSYTSDSWALQIGSSDDDVVFGNDIKTVGNYTYLIGRFKGTSVPFGNKVLNSPTHFSGFYAVFNNNNGDCEYAVAFGGFADDNNTILSLSNLGEVIIGGAYTSAEFQADPSGRLLPLSSSGNSQTFIARYSNDKNSSPTAFSFSFGDAPLSYGLASHYVYPCLTLGNFDFKNALKFPIHGDNADSQVSDDAISIPLTSNRDVDITNANFKLDTKLSIRIKVSNSSHEKAKLIAWIDFNKNKVFDPEEASTLVEVASDPTEKTYTLEWDDAKDKIQQGRTYLRIRLSTDDIANNQATGLFLNGEVEDYKLDFDLLDVKKAVTLSDPNRKLEFGDTLRYTIRIKSKIDAKILLFDPLPQYTGYVEGSANNGGGKVQVMHEGQLVDAVFWSTQTLIAGTEYSYEFKVIVNKLPTMLPANVYNVGFAVMNGDTIPTNRGDCNTLPISISSIKTNPDLVNIFKGDSKDISDVLKNDSLGLCAKLSLEDFDFVKETGPHFGNLSINVAKDLEYLPNTNHKGIDSVWYYIKCSGDSSANKVYYLTHEPLARNYYACPDAVVNLGFNQLSDVTYNWYTQEEGGTILTTANKIEVTKDGPSDVSTWWVEPVWKGIKFPRIRVDLEHSNNCGVLIPDPNSCAVTGTVLFREDFGGNSVDDPIISPVGIGSKSDYTYTENVHHTVFGNNMYTIAKMITPAMGLNRWWHIISDHTSEDPDIGYCFIVNGDTKSKVYELEIDNLCSNTSLYFSLWLSNILRPELVNGVRPDIEFVVEDGQGNVLSIFRTGETIGVDHVLTWKHYGFTLNTPSNISKIVFKIYSYGNGGSGNDYAVDDIEVRLCAPLVIMEPEVSDTIVCHNSNFKLEGSYIDDGTFGNNLEYIWLRKLKDSTTWQNWLQGTEISPLNIDKEFSVSKEDEGHYRLVVSNSSGVNNENCRAASDSIYIKVREGVSATDIRIKACPQLGTDLNLSKYLYEEDFDEKWNLNWTRVLGSSPEVKDAENGTIDMGLKNGTHIYQYTVANECDNKRAQLYISTTNKKQAPPSQVFVCKDFAETIHINQLFGLEPGTITVDNSAKIKPYLSEPITPSVFAGALVLNGKAVWNDSTIPTTILDGHTVKIVKFTYTVNGGCWLSGTQFNLEVVITKDLL